MLICCNFCCSVFNRGAEPMTAIHEITSVTSSDAGIYVCTATNSAGTEEERVMVRVDEGPTRGDLGGSNGYRNQVGSNGYRNQGGNNGYRDQVGNNGYRNQGGNNGYRGQGGNNGYRDPVRKS